MERLDSLLGLVLLVVGAPFAQWLYRRYWLPHSLLSRIPTVTFEDGKGDGRERYLYELRDLMRQGYERYTKHGGIFKARSSYGTWRVVIPNDAMREIKNASGNTLSWQKTMHDIMMISYTGAPDRAPWSARTLRTQVTKRLDTLSSLMINKINAYFDEHLTHSTTEWQDVECIHDMFRQCIAQITNLVFCGEELANDPKWVQNTMDLTAHSWKAASDVRRYPWWKRPFVSYVRPLESIGQVSHDREYSNNRLKPLFRERLAELQRSAASKGSHDDAFQWLLEAAGPNTTLGEFSDTMSRIMMASIHTTASASTFALADLLHRPEYIPDIVTEMQQVLGGLDTAPRATGIEGLKRMDSFIKESARFKPIALLLAGRKVTTTTPHSFASTGHAIAIPNGISVYAAAEAVLSDPDIYDDPTVFDGTRFLRLRAASQAADKQWMFANATLESLNFGYGAQACPGRWFAVQEMLLMFAKLLLDYEVEVPARRASRGEGYEEAPRARYVDTSLQPPLEYGMRVRRKATPLFPRL